MKAPRPRGAPIDMRRMRGWLGDFSNYRYSVTEQRIERWLSQFDLPHVDLAARVLDCVDFVTNEKIGAAFRSALAALPGWSREATQRRGAWRFAAFSASAGESGDAMLQKFRHANNLASRNWNSLFVHRSDLLTAGLKASDRIVLVDDFAGTGTQATRSWPLIKEFLPEGPEIHLVLVAASRAAMHKIERETEMIVHSDILLEERDAVFSEQCDRFADDEKVVLRRYCQSVESASAQEFSERGFVIVFAHACPNNTLPILHRVSQDWEGLFRRYD